MYPLQEGVENQSSEYKTYDTNDPNNALILGQQNAGNIEYLRSRVDNLDGVKEQIVQMKTDMTTMQTQMDSLVQQQADYAAEIAGGTTPPEVTGTEEDEEEETPDF